MDWSKLFDFMVANAALLVAVFLGSAAASIYFLRRYRDGTGDDRLSSSELLTKFRELHAKGELSDTEFRTIKTKLSAQLREELKDTKETG